MRIFAELTRDSLYAMVFHLAPRFANVFLYITIGRLSGPEKVGVFSLAMTYLLIFTTITRGLDDLVIRQVSRSPSQAAQYLTNFFVLRLMLSLGLFVVSVWLVSSVFSYANSTTRVILVMALSIVPDSVAYVPQAILMGLRRFDVLAGVLSLSNFLRLVGGWGVLLVGGGLQAVAWVWFVGAILGMFALTGFAVRQVGGLRRSDWLNWGALTSNWHTALSFLFITAMMTLEAQMDTLILSAYHDESVVGLYSAATTVTFSLVVFAQAYRFAVYPLMVRYAQEDPQRLSDLYKRSMRYLGAMVLPMVAGIILLAPDIVREVFGPDFLLSAPVLRTLIPVLVFIFLNVPDSRMMLVRDSQDRSLIFLAVSLIVNGVLNLMVDPAFGAIGAASARLCSSLLFFYLTHRYVVGRFVSLNLGRILFNSGVATLGMSVLVWAIRDWPLLISIGLGIVTYVLVLLLVGGIPRDDLSLVFRSLKGG